MMRAICSLFHVLTRILDNKTNASPAASLVAVNSSIGYKQFGEQHTMESIISPERDFS